MTNTSTPHHGAGAAGPDVTGSPIEFAFGDIEHELAATRRVLERYPDGRGDWRPHEKSMTLARLAGHVAELPGFSVSILTADEFDVASRQYAPQALDTAAELLALFERTSGALRQALAGMDAAALARPWTLRRGEQVIFSRPRGALLRTMGISHLVHHRAQLTVYFRQLGVPVPGLYGPSADEALG